MTQSAPWIEEQLRKGGAPAEITGEIMVAFCAEQGLWFAFCGPGSGDEYPPDECFRAGTTTVPAIGVTIRYAIVLEWVAEKTARIERRRWSLATHALGTDLFKASWERAICLAALKEVIEIGSEDRIPWHADNPYAGLYDAAETVAEQVFETVCIEHEAWP